MDILGGIGKLFGGGNGGGGFLGGILKAFKGIMDSPLGGLLKTAFPPLGIAAAGLNLVEMLGGLGKGVGAGQNY